MSLHGTCPDATQLICFKSHFVLRNIHWVNEWKWVIIMWKMAKKNKNKFIILKSSIHMNCDEKLNEPKTKKKMNENEHGSHPAVSSDNIYFRSLLQKISHSLAISNQNVWFVVQVNVQNGEFFVCVKCDNVEKIWRKIMKL